MPSKVNLAQIEYLRNGSYKPGVTGYIDLTDSITANFCTGVSDHATQVANLWQANGTKALVNNWYLCEALNFTLKASLWGQAPGHIPPKPAQWHLVILPLGFSCTWTLGANTQFALQCERDNVLALVSPADAGQGVYQFPCNVSSPNILKVASSTTGSNVTPQSTPDVYYPVDWNSYVQPAMVAAAFAQVLDWLLQNGIDYKANVLKQLAISTAIPDNQGRLIFHEGAFIAAVKAQYGAPPVPAPTPITPPPAATPPPVVVAPPSAPVDPLVAIAGSAGVSYDPAAKTFSNLTAAQVKQLAGALMAQGL